MAKEAGRSLPLSPFRRLVTDLMHFSRQVPAVTAERRMDLAPLQAVRQRCTPRPSPRWPQSFGRARACKCGFPAALPSARDARHRLRLRYRGADHSGRTPTL